MNSLRGINALMTRKVITHGARNKSEWANAVAKISMAIKVQAIGVLEAPPKTAANPTAAEGKRNWQN
ncbi:MAG: hypothetical protein IPJ71_19760 [Bdellovibrionales bacterium]|nr:hypothetical protein [Bdellovibrionales bacterium]